MRKPISEKRLKTLQADFEQAKPQYYLDSLQLIADERRLKDALKDMLWRFAHRTADGKRITSGGLWALEWAFDALGWDDPQSIESLDKEPEP
jgi:hypothetical protein